MSDTRMKDIFSHYYATNFWRDKDSLSGPGSNLPVTAELRQILPTIFAQLGITSLLDLPCGDFFWMAHIKEIDDLRYVGGDIVPELIYDNRERYRRPNLEFQVMDAIRSRLPVTDMILCRDLLVHFSYEDIIAALKNFRACGAKWLLATHFPGAPIQDISTGQWRPVDMTNWRFNLGEPAVSFLERSDLTDKKFGNKSLGLWRLNQ